MMPDNAIHEALNALNGVLWRKTAFSDLQWYYAEGGVYIFRCRHGEPDGHLRVIRARSADEAIARAAIDLHEPDEKKASAPVGDAAALREALKNLVDVIDRCDSGSPLWWHSGAKGVMPLKNAKAALAKPPRNCDVGTAGDQEERYINLKREYIERLTRCPAVGPSFFPDSLYWAQMPYEEGGYNGGK